MKKQIILLLALLPVAAISLAANEQPLSGNITKEVRLSKSYTKIVTGGAVDVVLFEANTKLISIEGKQKVVDGISITEANGTLTIESKSFGRRAVVYVPVSALEAIEANGDSRLSSSTTLSSAKITIQANDNSIVAVRSTGEIIVQEAAEYEMKIVKVNEEPVTNKTSIAEMEPVVILAKNQMVTPDQFPGDDMEKQQIASVPLVKFTNEPIVFHGDDMEKQQTASAPLVKFTNEPIVFTGDDAEKKETAATPLVKFSSNEPIVFPGDDSEKMETAVAALVKFSSNEPIVFPGEDNIDESKEKAIQAILIKVEKMLRENYPQLQKTRCCMINPTKATVTCTSL